MEMAPASAAAAAEGFPEHMGALSVGIDHGYGKVEDVREQHAKELQRDKKNDEAKAEAAAAKAWPLTKLTWNADATDTFLPVTGQ